MFYASGTTHMSLDFAHTHTLRLPTNETEIVPNFHGIYSLLIK